MRIKRIRRGCYDKYHRCPGWIGGGFRLPRPGKDVCAGGNLNAYRDPIWLRNWRFNFHAECGTLVLPYATRYVDPVWLYRQLMQAIFRRKY